MSLLAWLDSREESLGVLLDSLPSLSLGVGALSAVRVQGSELWVAWWQLLLGVGTFFLL